MDRNKKYWIKNTRECSALCLALFFIALESSVKIIGKSFSILRFECWWINTQVDAFKNLEETMHEQVVHRSQDSTFNLFDFFPKRFFQISSFQTRGAAYLRVWLIRQCLRYCNKSRRQWTLNIHFHKLGFHFLTSSPSQCLPIWHVQLLSHSSNLFIDGSWFPLKIFLSVVWFQTAYSIKRECFWIKS